MIDYTRSITLPVTPVDLFWGERDHQSNCPIAHCIKRIGGRDPKVHDGLIEAVFPAILADGSLGEVRYVWKCQEATDYAFTIDKLGKEFVQPRTFHIPKASCLSAKPVIKRGPLLNARHPRTVSPPDRKRCPKRRYHGLNLSSEMAMVIAKAESLGHKEL